MKIKKKLFLITLLDLCMFFSAHAEPMSLEKAILESVKNNPDIMMQYYAVSAAQSRLRAAKGPADLKMTLSGTYANTAIPVDSDDTNNSTAVVGSESFPGSIYRKDTDTVEGVLAFEKMFVFGLQTKLAFSLNRTDQKTRISSNATAYNNALLAYQDRIGTDIDPYSTNPISYGDIKLTLTLPLLKSFSSSLLRNQIESAQSYLFQQQLELENCIAEKIREVSSLYWHYVSAVNEYYQINEILKNFEKRRINLIRMIETGLVSGSELTLLDSNIAKQKIALIVSEQDIIERKSTLAGVMGISVPDDWEQDFLSEDSLELSGAVNELFSDEEKQIFLISAEQRNIGIRIKESELQRAKLAWENARISVRPDFDVFFSLGRKGSEYSDNPTETFQSFVRNATHLDYSGGFVFSCFLPNRNSGAADAAYQEYRQAKLSLDTAKTTLHNNLLSAFSAVEKHTEIMQKRRQVVDMCKAIVEGERKRFDAGLITVDTLYTTEETNREVKHAYLDSFRLYTEAVLNLKQLTGMLSGEDSDSFSGKSLYLLRNNISEKVEGKDE